MKNICQIFIFLTFYLWVGVISPSAVQAKTGEYLIGIFGIPEGNLAQWQAAGVNSLLVRFFEVERAKRLNFKKIYFTGVTPKSLREGLNEAKIDERMKLFKQAGDAYDYYLGDDLKRKHADLIKSIKQRSGLKRGIVGAVSGLRYYQEDDLAQYYYPLMRRQLRLSDMLKKQVRVGNNMHSSNRKLYIFAQAHPQMWYKHIIKEGNINEKAMLYPDGQAVRMLVYYALATGADGYFLFNWRGLSGKWSRERFLGDAQAILETKPLTHSIFNSQGTEFFQKTSSVYGTKIRGASYDLFFIFNADYNAHYHPTISKIRVNLRDVIGAGAYKAVYKYSPLGSTPVADAVDIPQDHALILVASKDSINVEIFKLDSSELERYAEILQARAETLSANLNLMGMSVPPLRISSASLSTKIGSILDYIDKLNEMKRNDWLKRTAGRLPTDGDKLNWLFWKKMLLPSQKDQLFNFYYR